jgi:hypothetical protein
MQPEIQKELAAMLPLESTHLNKTLRSWIVFNGGTTAVALTATVNSSLVYPERRSVDVAGEWKDCIPKRGAWPYRNLGS